MIFAPPEPDEGDGGCAAGCDDGIPCTLDSCDPATGACTHEQVDDACVDGNPCNGAETCDPTLGCVDGTPLDCDDSNDCTVDDCDPTLATGCRHESPDADGDTWFDADCAGDDCDDSDPDVHPGATEVCNGLDDDCAGGTDGGFPCIAGASQTGACGRCGTQTRNCDASCAWSTWGACQGEGQCSAETSESRNCSCDGAETEARVCSASCLWGEWLGCRACPDVAVAAVFQQSDFEVQAGALHVLGHAVLDDVWVYESLGAEEDDTHATTVTPCRGEGPRTVAAGWDVERKRVDDRNVRLLVRGVSDRDCGEGGQAVNNGEIRVFSPWTITGSVRCDVTPDVLASGGREIPTWCTVDPAAGTVTWQSGSECDGCCDCAEAAAVDIEVTVSRP